MVFDDTMTMLISHANRFVFVHNPKCAGSSVFLTLKNYHDDKEIFWGRRYNDYFGCEIDYGHLRLWEIHTLYPAIYDALGKYESMVLVRSPYERFISSLAQFLTEFPPNYDLQTIPNHLHIKLAERVIEEELTPERVRSVAKLVTFSPQIWFFNAGERRVIRHILALPQRASQWNFALRLLGVTTGSVGHANQLSAPLQHLLSVGWLLDWIEEFYKGDFEWLRKVPRLAHLTARPIGD